MSTIETSIESDSVKCKSETKSNDEESIVIIEKENNDNVTNGDVHYPTKLPKKSFLDDDSDDDDDSPIILPEKSFLYDDSDDDDNKGYENIQFPEVHETEPETSKRSTVRIMTKFEKAKILGNRSRQIAMGAPVMVDIGNEKDSLQLAIKELKEKKCPLSIRRFLPDGSHEDLNANELIIFDF